MSYDTTLGLTGRTLDCIVAEEVLGLEARWVKPDWYQFEVVCFYQSGFPLMVYSYDENACNACMHRNGVDDSDGTAQSLPHYSGEDSNGVEWEVVSAMSERHGCAFKITTLQEGDRVVFECEFTPKEGGKPPASARGEFPQEAICLAAVRYVRG